MTAKSIIAVEMYNNYMAVYIVCAAENCEKLYLKSQKQISGNVTTLGKNGAKVQRV